MVAERKRDSLTVASVAALSGFLTLVVVMLLGVLVGPAPAWDYLPLFFPMVAWHIDIAAAVILVVIRGCYVWLIRRKERPERQGDGAG